MLPIPELIITLDYSSIMNAFGDLRYVCEMKQRWDEIKKLNVVTFIK